MTVGLISGSIAAIVAALVSLPLQSPDDIIFNSATVVVGSLLSGAMAGFMWRIIPQRGRNYGRKKFKFLALWTIAFGVVVALAFVGETQLDRVVSFVLPLAGIVFVVIAVLTIEIDRTFKLRWWVAVVAIVIALGIGFGLAGQGDEESGRLTLPPRAGALIGHPFNKWDPTLSDQSVTVAFRDNILGDLLTSTATLR